MRRGCCEVGVHPENWGGVGGEALERSGETSLAIEPAVWVTGVLGKLIRPRLHLDCIHPFFRRTLGTYQAVNEDLYTLP